MSIARGSLRQPVAPPIPQSIGRPARPTQPTRPAQPVPQGLPRGLPRGCLEGGCPDRGCLDKGLEVCPRPRLGPRSHL
jgi:hypothetical protein